jgi:hypothetical protein
MMVLRFKSARNLKGTVPERFSVVLAPPQVVRNEHHEAQLMALSLLSLFLYMKTVASLPATLYNSGGPIDCVPSAFAQNLKMDLLSSEANEISPLVRVTRAEYWRQPEFRGGISKCQAENGHGN